MKCIAEISVMPPHDREVIMWLAEDTADREYKRTVTLTVAENCEALLICADGSSSLYTSGKHEVRWDSYAKNGIEIKKVIGIAKRPAFEEFFYKKDGEEFNQALAADIHSTFVVKLSLNQAIPFGAGASEISRKANLNCDCKCSVKDGYALYVKFNSPVFLRTGDVQKKLIGECQTALIAGLEAALKDYGTLPVSQVTAELSENICKAIKPVFSCYGITLENCNAVIISLNADGGESLAETKAQSFAALQDSGKTQIKCQRCGRVSPSGTRFCPVCGKALI